MAEGNSIIRFAKQAWGSRAGMQRAAKSEVDAHATSLKTTTFGFNFSAKNDYSVALQTNDGGTVYTRPDRMEELRSAARTVKRAQDTFGAYEPIEVVRGGKVVSQIDPDEILGK